MKKVILTCAIVLIATLSHAAFVDWTIDLGKADYAGKSYYLFNGTDSASVLESLGAFDTSTAANLSSTAIASGTLNTKAGKANGQSLDVGTANSLLMVVLNDTLDEGKTFIYGTMDISTYTYTPPGTPENGVFVAERAAFSETGTITKTTGIPEPTSGLLLLVGGALLALRRKQK